MKKDILRKGLIADRVNWSSIAGITEPLRTMAKIRYNTGKAPCVVTKTGEDSIRVDFDSPQEAPTPGQAVVFYDNDVVLGGGWITKAIP